MGQAPSGDTYNTDGKGLPLIAGAGDFGALSPKPSKFTAAPTKTSKPGDIILCIRATIGDLNWSDTEYCLGRGVAGLSCDPETLNQSYLWHWLGYAAPELKAKGRGAIFLQVSKADIEELRIPLPPLPEQRRIAAILDKADALRTKRREAIAKLDQLLQSVFIELFGSSQRINYTNLGTVAEINPSTVVATTGEVPFLPMADVDELEDFVAPKALRKGGEVRTGFTRFTCGDILVAKITPCFENGKTAIVRANGQSGAGSTEFHVIRVDNDDYARMLVTHLRRPHIRIEGERRMTGSAGQRRIPKAFLEGLQVPAPESEGIKRFAKLHRQVAAMKARYRRSDEQMHTLFASLQQRAFAGTL